MGLVLLGKYTSLHLPTWSQNDSVIHVALGVVKCSGIKKLQGIFDLGGNSTIDWVESFKKIFIKLIILVVTCCFQVNMKSAPVYLLASNLHKNTLQLFIPLHLTTPSATWITLPFCDNVERWKEVYFPSKARPKWNFL